MTEFNHHGIQGQKWGVTNGPPYPLDKETHKQVIKDKKKIKNETAKEIRKRLNKNYFTLGIGNKANEREIEMQDLIRKYYNQKMDYISIKNPEKYEKLVNKYNNKPYNVTVNTLGASMSYTPKFNKARSSYMYYY